MMEVDKKTFDELGKLAETSKSVNDDDFRLVLLRAGYNLLFNSQTFPEGEFKEVAPLVKRTMINAYLDGEVSLEAKSQFSPLCQWINLDDLSDAMR